MSLFVHTATLADMPFRQSLLADPHTMAYNAPWAPPDGCIAFPTSSWNAWLERWTQHAPERWCGYLVNEKGETVGEISWHSLGGEIGVVIHHAFRGRGYGSEGLRLLAQQAFRFSEIDTLTNRFEPSREPALTTHLAAGFVPLKIEDGVLTLRLTRERWEAQRRTAWLRDVTDTMCRWDTGDPKRIHHFLKVHSFARQIALHEQLDENVRFTLEVAALVHDIGIKPAEAQYGRCSGDLQEQLGPPEAEKLLQALGLPAPVIRRISFLVGHHHTTTHVAGADWQILLEADFLVNMVEEGYTNEAIAAYRQKVFRTEEGLRLLEALQPQR